MRYIILQINESLEKKTIKLEFSGIPICII